MTVVPQTRQITESSEVIIIPKYICPDPFRGKRCYLVLCSTHMRNKNGLIEPIETNTRQVAENAFEKVPKETEPMFGFEQEFFIYDKATGFPLGFSSDGTCAPQGPYYCGVGAGRVFGRKFVDSVVELAMKAQLPITGSNFEVAPGQAEIQVCGVGIEAADQLTILRYLLIRAGEEYNYEISFEPKPIKGDWNGTGCHINFSTSKMRHGTIKDIMHAVYCLERTHTEAIKVYGAGNEERLTGTHETSSMEKFTWGVADRSASVRIPSQVKYEGWGYIEDRRPAGNVDPYLATAVIMNSMFSK
jgi:glutamine synthetase